MEREIEKLGVFFLENEGRRQRRAYDVMKKMNETYLFIFGTNLTQYEWGLKICGRFWRTQDILGTQYPGDRSSNLNN